MPKKALIIGVNYIGQPCALRGCINDAWNVCSFLTHHYGYEPQNITLLSDDPSHVGSGLPDWAPPVPNPEKPRKSKKEKKDKKDKKAKKDKKGDKEDKKADKKDKKDKKEDKGDKKAEKAAKKAAKEEEKAAKKAAKKNKKGKKDEEEDDEEEEDEDEDEGETRTVGGSSSSSSSSSAAGADDDDEDDEPAEVFDGYGEDIAYYAFQYTAACRGIDEISRAGPGSVSRDVATRARILQGIEWLIAGAQPGDNLYFHFSGHGSQTKDLDGDEEDGFDETICPQDYKTAGMIVDDEIHAKLVEPLPAGVHLQIVMDCCHSGTGADLPYVFRASGPPGTPFEDKSSKKKKGKALAAAGGAKDSEATVVMISGCQDDQCSADVNMKGGATGAVSFSYICALMSHGFDLSYADLLYTMKQILAENSKSIIQCPQLSTNTKDFNFAQKFFC